MKNVANYITISRIIMSIILFATKTFSVPFYIIYIYCGISDMLDGFIARKSKTESEMGTKLDSVADIIFVIVAMIKIFPIINLSKGIIIWLALIVFIKLVNIICSYIYYKKIVFSHTIANKITGFVLFITPFTISINPIIIEIIICGIATFAAIQEGHYIRTKKIYGEIIWHLIIKKNIKNFICLRINQV